MGEVTRQVVLDTETTGLEASKGHCIIEIGCVKMNPGPMFAVVVGTRTATTSYDKRMLTLPPHAGWRRPR